MDPRLLSAPDLVVGNRPLRWSPESLKENSKLSVMGR